MKSGKPDERPNKKNDEITLNSSLKILYENPIPSTRTGAIYNAFSYPTKISPETIAIFIATHTKPGATVLDTFAGSGTTGLATMLCDKPTATMKLAAQKIGVYPTWGARKAVLYELGGLGSFISKTMCNPPCPKKFKKATEDLLAMAQKEIGWVYETKDPQDNEGVLRHSIWSDVLLCQKCGVEINYWDAVVRRDPLHLVDKFKCPSCKKIVMVDDCDRQAENGRDEVLGRDVISKKRVLAKVYGRTGTKTWERDPTEQDIELVERVLSAPIPAYAPKHKIVWGDLFRSGYHTGITHLHHFYTRRNFLVMMTLWHLIESFPAHIQDALRLVVLSYNSTHSTLMARVVVKNGENDFVLTGAQSGVLYVSGLPVEKNIFLGVKRKTSSIMKAFELVSGSRSKVEVCNASSTELNLLDESIDYVFTDPPFGDFIPYAEINQLNELWLGTLTNRSDEIIVSDAQGKDIDSYGELMGKVFKEIARVIKAEGKATVVFHSAKAAIWRALSLAYSTAGLNVVATSVLDKIQASFKQVVSKVSVKGDPLLLLSKKRNGNLRSGIQTSEQAFQEVMERARVETNSQEREPERLYSRYAARCLEMGIGVSLNAGEFYKKIRSKKKVSKSDGIKKGFETESARKKRLGQYYTGLHLAKLLAALAQAQHAKSVLDPMAGNGDMLVACHDIGARPKFKGAIEIDPVAHKACTNRIKPLKPLLGNAFDFSLLSQLPTLKWDLVITNPPYVRYQSMSRGVDASLKLPNAKEIRTSLISAIKHLPNLDTHDKDLFLHLCQKYSGLADLAVPSWILCTTLVKLGGTLAIVVPDSWLNREYALPIQYILLRWFKIRYIVEDINAAWFDEAQVKTNLLVAERIPRRDSAFDWTDEGFVHIHLSKDSKGENSIVGNIFPGTPGAEVRFAQEATRWYVEHTDRTRTGCFAHWTSFSHMSGNLQRVCSSQRWLSILGESETPGKTNHIHIPSELSHWLGKAASAKSFHSLGELGIHVGQGLRTGANRFFYADCLDVSGDNAVIAPSSLFVIRRVKVPRSCIAPSLRKQAELPDGYSLDSTSLKGCVLTLHNHALPEDLTTFGDASYEQTPLELAILIRTASEANFGTDDEPKRVYELSAVAPNIRKSRFWYMLPDFAPRHTPDLFIARVNNGNPKTFLNMKRASIIDANFSTIWLGKKSKIDAYALLAFFNCSWSLVAMEQSSSVMGGGALKVEATHLKKIPVPAFNPGEWSQLSILGKQLAEKDNDNLTGVLDAIDKVVVSRLTGSKELKKKTDQLHHFAKIHLERRRRK